MKKIKHKPRKSAVKRFRVTKNGKVLHRAKGARHLKSQKTKRQMRRLRSTKELTGTIAKKVKKMMSVS